MPVLTIYRELGFSKANVWCGVYLFIAFCFSGVIFLFSAGLLELYKWLIDPSPSWHDWFIHRDLVLVAGGLATSAYCLAPAYRAAGEAQPIRWALSFLSGVLFWAVFGAILVLFSLFGLQEIGLIETGGAAGNDVVQGFRGSELETMMHVALAFGFLAATASEAREESGGVILYHGPADAVRSTDD